MSVTPPPARITMCEVLAYLRAEYDLEINPRTVRNWARKGRQGIKLPMVEGLRARTNQGMSMQVIPATFTRPDLDEFLATQGVMRVNQ